MLNQDSDIDMKGAVYLTMGNFFLDALVLQIGQFFDIHFQTLRRSSLKEKRFASPSPFMPGCNLSMVLGQKLKDLFPAAGAQTPEGDKWSPAHRR